MPGRSESCGGLAGSAVPAIILTGDTSATLTRQVREPGPRALYELVTADTLLHSIREELEPRRSPAPFRLAVSN